MLYIITLLFYTINWEESLFVSLWQCVVLQCERTTMALNDRDFLDCIVILWDHHTVYSLVYQSTILRGLQLNIICFMYFNIIITNVAACQWWNALSDLEELHIFFLYMQCLKVMSNLHWGFVCWRTNIFNTFDHISLCKVNLLPSIINLDAKLVLRCLVGFENNLTFYSFIMYL